LLIKHLVIKVGLLFYFIGKAENKSVNFNFQEINWQYPISKVFPKSDLVLAIKNGL